MVKKNSGALDQIQTDKLDFTFSQDIHVDSDLCDELKKNPITSQQALETQLAETQWDETRRENFEKEQNDERDGSEEQSDDLTMSRNTKSY